MLVYSRIVPKVFLVTDVQQITHYALNLHRSEIYRVKLAVLHCVLCGQGDKRLLLFASAPLVPFTSFISVISSQKENFIIRIGRCLNLVVERHVVIVLSNNLRASAGKR